MNIRKSISLVAVSLALIAGLTAVLWGCSSGQPAQTTTSVAAGTGSISSATTSGPSSSQGTTSTSLPKQLPPLDKDLAQTATIQHQLSVYLTNNNVPATDPRMGLFYGLKARTLALSCRKALNSNDMSVADTTMRDVYAALNLGAKVATGSTAQILSEAHSIVATLGAPSDKPDQAGPILDQFVAKLAPLLDEATALTGAAPSMQTPGTTPST